MKRLAIILLLACCSSVGHAQYFSKHYPLLSGLTNGYISSIQVVDDTIYAMCGIIDTAAPYYPIALFDKFDRNGNLLSESIFNIPARTNIGVNFNNLIRTNDGGFAFGGNTVGTTQNQNAVLIIKYDKFGNFQWYKEIPDTNSIEFYCNAFMQDSFSNYYLSGGIFDSSYDSHSYIVKTDSLGNLITMKNLIDSSFDSDTWGLCINHKGHIVMGGIYSYVNYNNISTAKGGIEVYELDTGLNLLGHKMGTDSSIGLSAECIQPTNDGGYMCGGGYTCYLDSVISKSQGSVSKLDSNFQVIWTINTGPCSLYTTFEALSPSPDGNWIAVGQSYDDTDTAQTHINGWIMKFSEDGQIIWSKLYRGVTSDGINGDNNGLYSIAFMSDSSILCGGQAWNEDATIPPPQQGWLLHLDTAGCLPDSNSCGIVNGIADVPGYTTFLVFPNPASSVFTVALAGPNDINGYSDMRFTLYDLTGRMVMNEPLREQTTILHRNDLSDGMYLWQIAGGDKKLSNGKIVMR